ncbi:hypothetical protein HYQ46_009435 [Verticillium longisporum]|nr:hypothetical protein HYQ46_009435 [Verticillium longisporum]
MASSSADMVFFISSHSVSSIDILQEDEVFLRQLDGAQLLHGLLQAGDRLVGCIRCGGDLDADVDAVLKLLKVLDARLEGGLAVAGREASFVELLDSIVELCLELATLGFDVGQQGFEAL